MPYDLTKLPLVKPLLRSRWPQFVVTAIAPATFSDALPGGLMPMALVLIAGGVLTAVFARSPLQLAAGVLLALAGFDLIYARLEGGLLITGGLAVFQLAFAIVAGAFIGLDARPD